MSDDSELQLKRLPRFKPRGGVEVMYASIRALFLRELQTRFGHYRIGYLWALIEPSLNVVLMLILLGAVIQRTLPGIEYPVFLVNGILPFFMFRKSATKALGAISSNRGLFNYRSVKPVDTVLARTLLELFLYFNCYVVLTAVLIWIGYDISFSKIPEVLFYWLILFVLSFGFALIMMIVGSFSPEINKTISPLFLVLYFMSGALVPLHRIPEQYLVYFLWNPLAHLFELLRHAVSPSYIVLPGVSLGYILICSLVILFFGLLLCQGFNRKMLKIK